MREQPQPKKEPGRRRLRFAAYVAIPALLTTLAIKSICDDGQQRNDRAVEAYVHRDTGTVDSRRQDAQEGREGGQHIGEGVLVQREGQLEDKAFAAFKKRLLHRAMSFAEAKGIIEGSTGKGVRRYGFGLPDRYGLGRTKRMYVTQILPVYVPAPSNPSGVEYVRNGTNHVFDTYLRDGKDGRIAALASYILSRNGSSVSEPREAVETIAWWVMNNIRMDTRNAVIPPIEGKRTKEVLQKYGYGVTHSHPDSISIIRSSGVCMDYVNLTADLLNSIGTPSRIVTAATLGTVRGHPGPSPLKGVGHAFLQVDLPSGPVYYDVTPKTDGSRREVTSNRLTRIDSLETRMVSIFSKRYPGWWLFRVCCLAAMPEERLDGFPELKKILDEGMPAVDRIYDEFLLREGRNKGYSDFLRTVDKETRVYFRDVIIDNLHLFRRRALRRGN